MCPRTTSRGENNSNAQISFYLFTISPLMEMCPQKTRFTIGQFHHINITPYNDITISPNVQKILIHHYAIWKTKKLLYHFTPKCYWHIPIIVIYHHFTISWSNNFIISPQCYKCEPMRYNKKRGDKINFSRYNSNVLIDPYKHSIRDKKITKQTIILRKRRHLIFHHYSKSQN